MFKSLFKAIASVFTTTATVVNEGGKLITTVLGVTNDLATSAKHVSSSFEQRIALFETQKVNAITDYKKVQETPNVKPEELEAAYQLAMAKIKAINEMIKELEEAEDQA